MEKYQVLSRRYRPLVFSEIVGQQAIIKVLKNALKTGRIPHAFLFTGIRGTGKTTTARIFARALNCEKGIVVDPCNVCRNCVQQLEGRTLDILEIDGASNTSVNDVRMLKENTRFLPSQLRYKVYIIDEVHMLSTEAFNALLKTLEEPPEYVIFILATTEPQKIPETVQSRCVRLNFRRVEASEIYIYLEKVLRQESIEYEDSALHIIARQADGSVRDALSMLELVLAYGNDRVTEENVVSLLGLLSKDKILNFLNYLALKDLKSLLSISSQVRDEGGNFFTFTENILFYLRYLALMVLDVKINEKELSKDEILRLKEISQNFAKEEIPVYYSAFKKLLENIRFSSNPQFDFEVELIKISLLSSFLEESAFITSKKKIVKNPVEISKISESNDKESFIDFLSKRKPLIAEAVAKSNFFLEGNTLKIILSKDDQFFYELLKNDEKEEIKNIAGEFYGFQIDLKVELLSSDSEKKDKNSGSNSSIYENPMINLVMDSLPGSKILKIKEIKDTESSKEENIIYEEEDSENYIKGDDYE